MTGKPRERLRLIHLRCKHCNCYHYNTHNLGMVVVINTLYLNDPLENREVQHLSLGVQNPNGLIQAPAAFEHLRCLNTPYYSEYYTQLVETQNERVNMMETLELDTLSDTISIPESMPPLENFSLDSSYWE